MTKTIDSTEEFDSASPSGDPGGGVFQAVICEMEDAVFLIDVEAADGGHTFRVRQTNDAHQALTGLSLEAVRGRTLRELLGDEQGAAVDANYRRCVEAGEPIEYEESLSLPGGEKRWQTKLIPVAEDGSVTGIVGVARDVTEQRANEVALAATRAELRTIIDLAPDPVFVKDRDGTYLLANEATAAAYGKTPKEVEGNRESAVIPNPDDAAKFREDDRDVIESGEPREIAEERLTTAAGESRVYQTRKVPYEVPTTGEDVVLGYARDITEFKEYERALEKQRDALTLLNQVVRHDIRNQLMVVESYTELLEESLVDDRGRTYARTIIGAARQAADITETAREVTEVLLQVGTARTRMRLRTELGEQIAKLREDRDRATISVDEPIPDVTVLADELLRSVFRNLLVNAVVHNDKETVDIRVSADASDDAVRVSIADNGPGIADRHKEQIYEEGESGLKSGGTGVGLYLVKTLVDRYGGDVWVEDNEPTGSVFVVELPLAD